MKHIAEVGIPGLRTGTVQTIQITAKYVNPPKEAQWADGTIKDQNNTMYTVKKEFLGMFQPGATYNITVIPRGQSRYQHIISANGNQLEPLPPATQPQPAQFPAPQTPPPPTPGLSLPPKTSVPLQSPPLLSNVLAHAIQQGLISTPEQMAQWATWVKEAEKAYQAGAQAQPDPGIPDYHMNAPVEPQ